MCPGGETLSAYLDNEVEGPWKKVIEEHLTLCLSCKHKLDEMIFTREQLALGAVPDFRDSQERGRSCLAGLNRMQQVSFWRRRVALPLPAAAAAVLLTIILGFSTLLLSLRTDYRFMSIRTQPSGTSEVLVTAPIDDLERILKSLELNGSRQEIIIQLPKEPDFFVVGEAEMFRAAEYKRDKPW